MRSFVYTGQPARVIFGRGTLLQVAEEAATLGVERAIILSTPGRAAQAAAVADALGARAVAGFTGAATHTPVEVTAEAMRLVEREGVDGTVAIGGGSTIGLGKAIALRTGLPQVAVPTTYAGSEMTPILGQTEGGLKTTTRDPRVLPEVVIYDVELTLSLPPGLSGTSGVNAIAHAVEALYARDGNPAVTMMAEEGIRAMAAALPAIAAAPRDATARDEALYGAWLCAMTVGAVGLALHHKLCHVLGGAFGLPHAETHSVVLPHAAAYNAPAAPEAMVRVARALGTADAPDGLYALNRALDAPAGLKALGMPEDGVERAADLAMQNPYWNPRPLERGAIRDLIARAWAGTAPET